LTLRIVQNYKRFYIHLFITFTTEELTWSPTTVLSFYIIVAQPNDGGD